MTDDRVDHLLADLDAALDVEPSKDFVRRVRAISAVTPARRLTAWWPWLAAGAAVAVAVTLVVAGWPRDRTPSAAKLPGARGLEARDAAALRTPRIAAPIARVVQPASSSPAARRQADGLTQARPAAVIGPMFEVITNQAAVLDRAWRRAASGSGELREEDLPVAGTTPDHGDSTDIALRPVTIDPIVVGTLEGQPPASTGGTIRRDVAGRER